MNRIVAYYAFVVLFTALSVNLFVDIRAKSIFLHHLDQFILDKPSKVKYGEEYDLNVSEEQLRSVIEKLKIVLPPSHSYRKKNSFVKVFYFDETQDKTLTINCEKIDSQYLITDINISRDLLIWINCVDRKYHRTL